MSSTPEEQQLQQLNGYSLDRIEAYASDIAHAYTSPDALTAAAHHLREKLIPPRCSIEYQSLESLQDQLHDTYDYLTALQATKVHLNRYSDVLPYEHSRIKLSNRAAESVDAVLDGYINASMIECSDPATGSSWQYIAAQGPLPQTAESFWRMVVQHKSHSIVRLTDLIENKRRKCHPYFALKAGSVFQASPSIRVRTLSAEEILPGLVCRHLEVEYSIADGANSMNSWQCEHYHFTAWPDHGVPDHPTPILVLSALLRSKERAQHNKTDSDKDPRRPSLGPLVVHCSAGIGRTGVFCAIDSAARLLIGAGKAGGSSEAACNAIEIGQFVATLRHQRAGMVQTEGQFVFCHTALMELIEAAIKLIQ